MKFSLVFEHSAWFIFLCLIVAAAYALLLYYKDKKIADLTLLKRRTMLVIRFLSTFLISILLLSPVFKAVNQTIDKPIIIFAFDNSQSIQLSGKFSKQDEKKLYETIDKISKNYNVKLFSFADKVKDTINFDYKGQSTNISNAIEQISNRLYNKNIGAMVIISDGIYNEGIDPSFKTENSAFPIYTVGIGDTSVYKDLFIKYLDYNDLVFLKNKFPVIVTVGAKKLNGQSVVCSIFDQNKNLLSVQNVNIKNNNDIQKIVFFLEAKKPGVEQFTVTLNVIEGEKNTLNNTKSFAVQVIENKEKILILANAPHPDISALLNALKTNENYDIDVDYIDNFSKKITDYSLIVIHQLPARNKQFAQIYQQIVTAKKPVLLICGTQTDYQQLNNLNFGFKINQQNNAFDFPYGYVSSNFSDFNVSKEFDNLLNTTDPLIVPFGEVKLSGNSKIILFQKVKNINTNKPLLFLTTQPNNTKIAVFVGEDIWRWRMQCFQKNANFDVFDQFINQLAQLILININKNRFIVKVDKINTENADILFYAEAYNEIYELTNVNDVLLKITDNAGKIYDFTFNKTLKSYELNVGAFPVGDYKYSATTKIGTQNFSTSGTFTVIKSNIESQNLIADFSLLSQLASKSGGKFYEFKNIDNLKQDIDKNDNIKSIMYETQNLTEIVKYKWIFFFILTLLSIEWFLRKFFGTY